MPIISIAVLILFQRSILRPWKKLNSLQFLPSLAGWQCFLHTHYQSLNGKAALGRKIFCLGLQQPVAITDDIVQVIRIKRVMLQFQEVMSIYKTEFWCELTIAVLFWENAELWFAQKYTLTFTLREGEGVGGGLLEDVKI